MKLPFRLPTAWDTTCGKESGKALDRRIRMGGEFSPRARYRIVCDVFGDARSGFCMPAQM